MLARLIHGCLCLCAVGWLAIARLHAAEQHGVVKFGGLPVPGATVTASQADKRLVAITDSQGTYSFPDLPDGTWTIQVEMQCFATLKTDVSVSKDAPAKDWELQMLPFSEIQASATAAPPPPSGSTSMAAPPEKPAVEKDSQPAARDTELEMRAMDGLLINGSDNNGASSPFAMAQAFGNYRKGAHGLYNGSLGLILDNSALDARPFSLTGQNTLKPSYSHVQGVATLGGPLKIGHLFKNAPVFFVGYQWTRNRNATTQTSQTPDTAERSGAFTRPIIDPLTGSPFPGNMIPASRLSPQALALLKFYPLPNFAGSASYNYQVPLIGATHQDALESRAFKSLGNKNQIYGGFAFQSTRTDTPSLFNFLDTTDILGLNANLNWRHAFSMRLYGNLGYQFSRSATRTTSNFENRENVSAEAGITGNNQDPMNWGPPALSFASGVANLSDALAAHNRNQTSAVSYSMLWSRGPHNVSFGGDFRRQEFNYLSQQDPRGTFTFTGAATGFDFADFLLGIPDTSSIAFGNADKCLRASSYDGFITDDLRVSPQLTVNAGIRWEYGSPITELYGRLVNLDITPGFAAEAPVVANNPIGPLTGQTYPASLLRPDKHGFQPRVGIAWRPISGSSMVVRAGYGIYYNTSVYQTIASQMMQQSPLSKSLSVQNSAADPLTLANGFNASPSITPNTFAIDPNFRVGYAHNWQASVQSDLPGSLILTVTYLGIKGTRGLEQFLPNTYPAGALNPCPTCPSGYAYLTSNGNSTRESGEIQLRRRLHNGFTATLQYTFSKSIDDAALGGRAQGTILTAQNWLDLSAERGLSNFDQRHLLSVQAQYTSGMGIGGGTLLNGWRGALLKEWTLLTQITAGSGLPLTPLYPLAVNGTGVTGPLRPEYTGAPLYIAPPGLSLNPEAYTEPVPGEWGSAGRNSIIGPVQFALNASLARTFRWGDRLNADLRVDSTNALNHVTYTSWNTTVGNAQFGLPTSANAMRSMQVTLRVRF
jgi:hypothetical protein